MRRCGSTVRNNIEAQNIIRKMVAELTPRVVTDKKDIILPVNEYKLPA
jgi:hypothetical protein